MKLRITEEQLKALLGQGFVKYLNESEVSYDDAGRALTPGMEVPEKFREVDSYSPLQAKHKMVQIGKQSMNKTSTTPVDEVNNIIKYMVQCNGGRPLSLIEALQVLQQIKSDSQFKTYLDSIYGEGNIKVEDFLNTVNISTILSNFLTQIPQDYVFYRLTHLTSAELENIKKVYKVDFINFGQQCDACGISDNWATSIFKGANGDAHINLEYMGKDKSSLQTQKLRFQIHHMNGNPSDNSPLNLACLCPNCHSITDSYGTEKSDEYTIKPEEIAQLQKELNIEGETDELAKNIAQRLIEGYFNDRTIQQSMVNNIYSAETEDISVAFKQEVNNLSQTIVEAAKKIIRNYSSYYDAQNANDSNSEEENNNSNGDAKKIKSKWNDIGKYKPNQDLIKGCDNIDIKYYLKKERKKDFSTGKEFYTYKGYIKLIPLVNDTIEQHADNIEDEVVKNSLKSLSKKSQKEKLGGIEDNLPKSIEMSYCQNANNQYLQKYVESVLAPYALWNKTAKKLNRLELRTDTASAISTYTTKMINLQAKENILAKMHPELLSQITKNIPQERIEQVDALIAKLPDKAEVNAAISVEAARLKAENAKNNKTQKGK